jgi:ribonuclease T2
MFLIGRAKGVAIFAAFALLCGLPVSIFCRGASAAEAGDCVLDKCVAKESAPQPDAAPPANDTTRAAPFRRSASAPGDFDFYVLSLSWSSGFCATGGAAKGRSQCGAGANLGFVVHGLWPQYEQGYPSDCGPAGRVPSRIALQSAQGLFPDEGLARYEWRKHGTCSGKSPTDYFADVRRARDAIIVPPSFREAKEPQTWTPVDIERAFIAANPRLRPGMLAVACTNAVLQEIRICFAKDLRDFRACPEVSRQNCRTREISVPPMR